MAISLGVPGILVVGGGTLQFTEMVGTVIIQGSTQTCAALIAVATWAFGAHAVDKKAYEPGKTQSRVLTHRRGCSSLRNPGMNHPLVFYQGCVPIQVTFGAHADGLDPK